jgi:MerR family copper efflux transcriptional regulator
MKIGELAAATGLAPSAIRFYEQSGLLPAAQRAANGYRSYSASAVERLRFIQLAQALGFTLDALRVNLVTRAAQTPAEIHDDLLQRLDTRLVEIDQMLGTLRAQRKDLLSVRAQMEVTWAAGDCLNPSGVKLTPAEPAAARARARRVTRTPASASVSVLAGAA